MMNCSMERTTPAFREWLRRSPRGVSRDRGGCDHVFGSNLRIAQGIPPQKGGRMTSKSSSGNKGSGKGGGNYHSAKTGKFVSEKYAKQHPSTTFKESPRKK